MADELALDNINDALIEAVNGKPVRLGKLWQEVDELEARAAAAKELAAKYTAQSKAAEAIREEFVAAIFDSMKEIGADKVDVGFGLLRIKTNGGNQAVKITGVVPPEYQRTKVENDTKKIGEALKAGDILGFAHLAERGEHLEITAV